MSLPTAPPEADQMTGRDGYLPWRPALAAAARVIVGAGSATLGVLAFTMNLGSDVPVDWPFLLFAAVLTLGGAALLVLPRLRLSAGWPAWLAGGATTLGGLAVAAFLPVRETCCDAAYIYSRGLPLPWAANYGDTPGQARAITLSGADTFSVVADVVFWLFAGLLAGVAAAAVRRLLRGRPG
jgi:hypothetical protein